MIVLIMQVLFSIPAEQSDSTWNGINLKIFFETGDRVCDKLAYLSSLAPDKVTPAVSDVSSIKVVSLRLVSSGGRGDCDNTGEYVIDLFAEGALTSAKKCYK